MSLIVGRKREISVSTLQRQVEKTIPRCLALVSAVPTALVEDHDCVATAFALSQKAGSAPKAQVLGYPLADYNSACKGDPDFIGPLTLRWSDSIESLVFDSEIHGYHGEMESSAKLHGSGSPKAFACIKCGHDKFAVVVQFDYWDECEDLLEDEPDISIEDYFSNIMFVGTCAKCQTSNEILNMDL